MRDLVEREWQDIYVYRGVPYLPHYVIKGKYVPPGRDATPVDWSVLVIAGAAIKKEFLWIRKTGEANESAESGNR